MDVVEREDVEDVIFRGVFPSLEERGSLSCQRGGVQNDTFLVLISSWWDRNVWYVMLTGRLVVPEVYSIKPPFVTGSWMSCTSS